MPLKQHFIVLYIIIVHLTCVEVYVKVFTKVIWLYYNTWHVIYKAVDSNARTYTGFEQIGLDVNYTCK